MSELEMYYALGISNLKNPVCIVEMLGDGKKLVYYDLFSLQVTQ